MSKAHSKPYRMVRNNITGHIEIYKGDNKRVASVVMSLEEWSHMIANPEVINPPEEEEEALVA